MWSGTCLPAGCCCGRMLKTGFSWWLMPQNQSIGRCGSEIRCQANWPEGASDLSIIHLCPHLVPLNVSVVTSSIKFTTIDKAGRCDQFVSPARAEYHAHSSLCILETPAHRNKHRAHCTRSVSPLKVSGTQTKLLWRWVMGSTGPYWICFEDEPGV